jgi:hypothetical protein
MVTTAAYITALEQFEYMTWPDTQYPNLQLTRVLFISSFQMKLGQHCQIMPLELAIQVEKKTKSEGEI